MSLNLAGLPDSIRDVAELIDVSATFVLSEGRLFGLKAADDAVDGVGDRTARLIEEATGRRVLVLTFERNTAGQGA